MLIPQYCDTCACRMTRREEKDFITKCEKCDTIDRISKEKKMNTINAIDENLANINKRMNEFTKKAELTNAVMISITKKVRAWNNKYRDSHK